MSHRVETIRRISSGDIRVDVGPSPEKKGKVRLSVFSQRFFVSELTMDPGVANEIADAIYDRIAEIEMSDKEGE